MPNDPAALCGVAQLFRLLVEGGFSETVCCLSSSVFALAPD